MRGAFQAAFAAWAALVSAAIFADTPMLVGAIAVSALGLTLLLARGLGVAVALSILPRLISVRRIYEYFGVGR